MDDFYLDRLREGTEAFRQGDIDTFVESGMAQVYTAGRSHNPQVEWLREQVFMHEYLGLTARALEHMGEGNFGTAQKILDIIARSGENLGISRYSVR